MNSVFFKKRDSRPEVIEIPAIAISEEALDAIRHDRDLKLELAFGLRCSEGSINRYLREEDSRLTEATAVLIIRKHTGMTLKRILTQID